jgi:hypothetical protein
LEIAFSSKEIRTVCEDDAEAQERFGEQVAAGIRKRLADLRAAASVADIIVGNVRSHADLQRHCKLLDLSQNAQLVFCSNHPKPPFDALGAVDWTKVTRIIILEVMVH